MNRFILAAALCGSLAACATPPPQTTIANSVAAVQLSLTSAINMALLYTRMPRCNVAPPPCSDPATVQVIKSYEMQAYDLVKAARDNEALIIPAADAVKALVSAIPR